MEGKMVVQRYDVYGSGWWFESEDDGEYVRYDDHAAELSTLRDEVERLREEVENMRHRAQWAEGELRAAMTAYDHVANEALK